jgi:CheY-like chemotaxis protein
MSAATETLAMPVSLTSLSVGLADTVRGWLKGLFESLSNRDLPCDLEALITIEGPEPSVVFCSEPAPGVSLLELAQVLRSQYREAPIYFLADSRTKLDRADLKKNGFTDVFFLPIDGGLLERALDALRSRLEPGRAVYDEVHLLDLQPGVTLDFDTYIHLPFKKKYLKYSAAGDALDAERVERLKSFQVSALYVARQDMPKFYNYAAQTLRALKDDPGLSQTVRQERMHSAIRNVFAGLFTETVTST